MLGHARVYSKDEELGKRDDDFRPRRQSDPSNLLRPWRWRKRRMITVLAGLALLYLFVKNIPTDLGPANQRLNPSYRPPLPKAPVDQVPYPNYGDRQETKHNIPHDIPHGSKEETTHDAAHDTKQSNPHPPINKGPTDAPPRPKGVAGDHYFNGKVKFYKLAPSLRAIARTMGAGPVNRNVLFAASSLKSVANLLPMACEMGRFDRNYVHVGLFGRDALPLDDILAINGVDAEKCDVTFHDARSDYSEYSTDVRAEISVDAAMKFVHEFMHPQAIIMDDSILEDQFFTRAMRGRATNHRIALIEIPVGRYEDFLWIARLDSGSLSNWFKPKIDILIHSALGTSGNLFKLIKSLMSADYDGLRIPRLTIDLPTDVAQPVKNILREFEWPPIYDPSPMKSQTINLHHRISTSQMSPEQASIRFLESFYPNNPADNHVLVLSPQAQLSPVYLQYLHYNILEYKYSSYKTSESDNLFGISLDVPTEFLNGTGGFENPLVSDMRSKKYAKADSEEKESTSPFLYQAPSSAASLIFGDKWATLHNFLSNRLAASHTGKTEKPPKLISETQPAWLEYLLELMRARGWLILHPSKPFVTLHNEGAQIPEEFLTQQSKGPKEDANKGKTTLSDEGGFLTAGERPKLSKHVEYEMEEKQALHHILQFEGDLPELPHLPHMSYTGNLFNPSDVETRALEFAADFRRHVGLCNEKDASRKRVIHAMKTDDLFCLPGTELEFDSSTNTGTTAKKVAKTGPSSRRKDGRDEYDDDLTGVPKAT